MDPSECRRIVERHIVSLKDACGLSHWTVTVSYRRVKGAAGECRSHAEYERAHIKIDPRGFDDGDEEGVLRVLRHELFHAVISPGNLIRYLAASGVEGREYDRVLHTINYATEQSIRNLERLWWCVEEYWRSVIAKEAKVAKEKAPTRSKPGAKAPDAPPTGGKVPPAKGKGKGKGK